MTRKIKCICIDGMEKTGKTSVAQQLCKYLKEHEKKIIRIKNSDIDSLISQKEEFENNKENLFLKQNGIMSQFHDNFKNLKNMKDLMAELGDVITEEKNINHQYGVVNFFLVPEDMETVKNMFSFEKIPNYYNELINFYKNINQTSITQGLDVRLIIFNEHDRIFDIRDKILKILEKQYKF